MKKFLEGYAGHVVRRMAGISIFALMLTIFAVALTSCDSNAVSDDTTASEMGKLTDDFVSELSLTDEQTAAIESAMQTLGNGDPAALWNLSAELQKTLTAEQKTELFSLAENRHDSLGRPDSMGHRGRGPKGGRGGRPHGEFDGDSTRGRRPGFDDRRAADSAAAVAALGLTAEQIAAMQALREEGHVAMDSLHSQLRAGTIDFETFRTRMDDLRTAGETKLAEILTAEQLEIMKIHGALAMQMRGHGGRGKGHGRGGHGRGGHGPRG